MGNKETTRHLYNSLFFTVHFFWKAIGATQRTHGAKIISDGFSLFLPLAVLSSEPQCVFSLFTYGVWFSVVLFSFPCHSSSRYTSFTSRYPPFLSLPYYQSNCFNPTLQILVPSALFTMKWRLYIFSELLHMSKGRRCVPASHHTTVKHISFLHEPGTRYD